jgi:BirA family biotin operon repressor/biotin-[acetyl-CoA-carboxylase] ligase
MGEEYSARTLTRPGSLIGWKVEVFEKIGSTNDDAMRRGAEGEKEGLVIIAEVQEKGRGRLGRTWESPPGVNILMSVLLRPGVSPEAAPVITLLSAVAVARAVEKETGLQTRIKWPNDLEVKGKKLCGILTQMSVRTGVKAHEGLEHVVSGIGLNVNMAPGNFPGDLAQGATSILAELGRPVERSRLTIRLMEELEREYMNFLSGKKKDIFEEWHKRARMRGQDVKVLLDGKVIEGRMKDLDDHGALLLETKEGVRRILAGDVQWMRRAS